MISGVNFVEFGRPLEDRKYLKVHIFKIGGSRLTMHPPEISTREFFFLNAGMPLLGNKGSQHIHVGYIGQYLVVSYIQ